MSEKEAKAKTRETELNDVLKSSPIGGLGMSHPEQR